MPNVSRRYAGAAQGKGQKGPAPAAAPVVLMVSGGADSTALLLLACTAELDIQDGRGCARIARERLHVLHVNHQLRGSAADADEAFVSELCNQYGVPLKVERVDVAALAQARGAAERGSDSNIENVAREVRYAAANQLANELCTAAGLPRSAARIVTAHTANDRAETFFMNAIKGSGAQGLSSIPRRRNRIVRPLLDYTHAQLCDMLRMRGISWREDATNADTTYLRAYVRHEIVPRALERNSHLLTNLSATCDILSDEDAYLAGVAARTFHMLEMRRDAGAITLDAAKLAATEIAIARRVVRMAVAAIAPNLRLSAAHVAAVLELVAAGQGSTTLPESLSVRVQSGLLTFVAPAQARAAFAAGWLEVPALGSAQNSTTVAKPGTTAYLSVGQASITARLREVAPGSDPVALARAHGREWEGASVLLDAEALNLSPLGGRLWVEPPQVGDILCPLGMHGQSKKVSDLLIDEKIPAHLRLNVPVVRLDPKGQIVWVAPIRADERARVTPQSRVLLELHFRGENL